MVSELRIARLFAHPIRVFFFITALWASLSMPLWLLIDARTLTLPLALPPNAWHAHEMFFGFLGAAIAGFMLTGISNWTETKPVHGWPLAGIAAAWLAGRVLMFCGANLPYALVAGVNLLFMALVLFNAAGKIFRFRDKKLYMMLVVFGLFWVLQLLFLRSHGQQDVSSAVLILSTGIMMIVGGKITPTFSRNWLSRRERDPNVVRSFVPLEAAVALSVVATFATVMAGLSDRVFLASFYPPLLASVSLLSAALITVRIALWKGWLFLRDPLMFILHISLLWIPVALVLFALYTLGVGGGTVLAWMHAMGAGAISCLILSVLTRGGLGHTGRALVAPSLIPLAYLLLHLGAVARVSAEFLPGVVQPTWIRISGVLWTVAFLIYLFRYIPFLFRARADGLPD